MRRQLGGGEASQMRKLLAIAGLVAAFLLTASTVGAAPIVSHFHGKFSDTFDDNICGIDGTSVVSGMDNIQEFADGTFKDEFRLNQVFTSDATGKSLEIFVAEQFTSKGPIDNGDGTVTFVDTFKGMPEKLKIPNGPILSRDAGNVTFLDTFDATTGEFISSVISTEKGPHPDLDSGFELFCDVVVPALS
jgi:hypothetical protein